MSRLPQKADIYARANFQREMRSKMGWYGYDQSALEQKTGISQSTISNYINKDKPEYPDKITVANLRKLIKTLNFSPDIVMELLGYSKKEAQNYELKESVQ